MAQQRALLISVRSLSAAFLTAGCGLIEPSHPDAQVDAASDEGGVRAEPDAGLDGDAAADAAVDAGALLDAGCNGASCGEAGADSCTTDAQCANDSYCSRVSLTCRPRCDPALGCVGPTLSGNNNRVVTDGTRLCYADDATAVDGPGYILRSWDGSEAEPRAIAEGPAELRALLIADGYCYYATPSLRRARLSGSGDEHVQELGASPRRAWLSQDHIWWVAPHADGLDLYRLARSEGATAELFATVPSTTLWETGNEGFVFRKFSPASGSCALAMAPLTDLADETVIPMTFSRECRGAMWADEESVMFVEFEPVRHNLFRVHLDNLAISTQIKLASTELLMYQVRGNYAYGQRVRDGSGGVPGARNTISYMRARMDGSEPLGEVIFSPTPGVAAFKTTPADGDNVYRTFAVLGERLVYQHLREFRLIVQPLPAEPPYATADAGP